MLQRNAFDCYSLSFFLYVTAVILYFDQFIPCCLPFCCLVCDWYSPLNAFRCHFKVSITYFFIIVIMIFLVYNNNIMRSWYFHLVYNAGYFVSSILSIMALKKLSECLFFFLLKLFLSYFSIKAIVILMYTSYDHFFQLYLSWQSFEIFCIF